MTAQASTTETCDYCGLPLAEFGRRPQQVGQPASKRYCCLGCRWAAEVARERQQGAGLYRAIGPAGIGDLSDAQRARLHDGLVDERRLSGRCRGQRNWIARWPPCFAI